MTGIGLNTYNINNYSGLQCIGSFLAIKRVHCTNVYVKIGPMLISGIVLLLLLFSARYRSTGESAECVSSRQKQRRTSAERTETVAETGRSDTKEQRLSTDSGYAT